MPAFERIFFRHGDCEARIIVFIAVVLHGGKTPARMPTHTPYVSRVWRPAFAEASAGQRSSGSEPPATCSQSNVLHPALNGKMLLSKESPCREMFRFMHLLEPIT